MFNFFKKLPLPQQLGWGSLISVVLATAVFLFLISEIFNHEINAIAEEHQLKEVHLIASQLESEYQAIVNTTDILAAILQDQFSALQVDASKSVKIGQINSPLVTLNGDTLNLNYSAIDRFTKATGASATIFARDGEDFLRVTTSLKKENNQRAIGTYLGSAHPGYKKLMSGQAYSGKALLFGKNYMTKYLPVQKAGKTIAILYIGVAYDEILANINQSIRQLTFGKSGYVFIADTGKNEGDLLIHPSLSGKNIYTAIPELKDTFAQMFATDQGTITYQTKITGQDQQAQDSKAIFKAVKGWNWVVAIKLYRDEYREVINTNLVKLAMIAIVGALLLSMLLWYFIRRSLQPMTSITAGLQRLGSGDLSFRFDTLNSRDSKNEMDLLKRDVTAMRDGLIRVIKQVLASSELLVEASQAISSVNTTLQQQARSSESECSQVASAIDQVAVSIDSVAQSTNEVSEKTTAASLISRNGNDSVQDVENTVGKLAAAFNQASTTIQEVELNSKSIGDVVDVINAIAEQTNLLALNAAIEAARAGEQGRGFAVVADEVRVLAQRTQQSTKEIRDVVERLQTNSRTAVDGMEQGTQQVAQSVEKVANSRQILADIQSSISAVEERMNSVASATEEQSVAASQIKHSVHTLNASATETFTLAERSQNHSQAVANLASQLAKDLNSFKL